MAWKCGSARITTVVAKGDSKLLEEAPASESSNCVKVDFVSETELRLLRIAGQAVISKMSPQEKGLRKEQMEGLGEKQMQNIQDNSVNEGETVYHNLKAPIQRSFGAKSMEEVHQDLSTVKQAANLTKQEILEFVADHALFWLQLAYQKIHGDKLSTAACHMEEARVIEAVKGLKTDQSNFPQQIESIIIPSTDAGAMVTKNKMETTARQVHSEDHCDQNMCHSKHLLKGAATGQPPNKKSKIKGDDDNDDDNNEVQSPHESVYSGKDFASVCGDDNDNGITAQRELYSTTSEDTRTAYLSEFLKFLQTINGSNFKEDEAFENTYHVHKMMEAMDSSAHTIDCLLNHKNILGWIETYTEANLSGRTLQKYLLSLERFYDFLSWCHLPEHLPQFSDEAKDLVSGLKLMCQNRRRGVTQSACEKSCMCPLVEPVCNQQKTPEADRTVSRIHSNLEENFASTETSLKKCNLQGSTVVYPQRKKWEKKDVQLLCTHFGRNPGKAAIRKKMLEDEELEKLMKKEGFVRCYEKVKSLYKKKKIRSSVAENHSHCKHLFC